MQPERRVELENRRSRGRKPPGPAFRKTCGSAAKTNVVKLNLELGKAPATIPD
jgi:hypothetical protein